MNDAIPPKAAFHFALGDQIILNVATPQQLRNWIDAEEALWIWLGRLNGYCGHFLQPIWEPYRTFFASIRRLTEDCDQRGYQQRETEIQNAFSEFYTPKSPLVKPSYFHSSHPSAKFVLNLSTEYGIHVAAGALATLSGKGIELKGEAHPGVFQGIALAGLYLGKSETMLEGHEKRVRELEAKLDDRWSEETRQLEKSTAEHASLIASTRESAKTEIDRLRALEQSQKSSFEQLIAEFKKSIDTIEDTYKKKLALQAPVTYWTAVEQDHKKAVNCFFWASVITFAVLVVAMWFVIKWTLGGLIPGQNPQHWHLGILVLCSFFSVWLMRLLVRMILSHKHLATDAAERKTMLITYLALSLEGNEFTKEDRLLILGRLFSPASDGLVKDDAAPPSLFDQVWKRD